MNLFDKQGQDAFLTGFDTIEKAVDSVLLNRKPKQIKVIDKSRASCVTVIVK